MGGIPARFEAGRQYQITVELSRNNLRRGGFELSARFDAGRMRGRQAGIWRLLDSRAQVQPSKNKRLLFVQHTATGTIAADRGSLQWTVEWTAPSTASTPVRFNVAGNASNDDASPLGDWIYLSESTSSPVANAR